VHNAYVELRERLVCLSIAPGSPIDEKFFARELGVGRALIREASSLLAADELVTAFPQRGAFASVIRLTDLSRVCDARSTLEGPAARRVAQRRGDADRNALHALRRDLVRSVQMTDLDGAVSLYLRVHRFMFRCDSESSAEQPMNRYLNLSVRIWRSVTPRLPDRFAPIRDRDGLLAAIAAGAGERAQTLQLRHIARFEEIIRAGL
jgi:DNA-binding GntR family transcriptional regulator